MSLSHWSWDDKPTHYANFFFSFFSSFTLRGSINASSSKSRLLVLYIYLTYLPSFLFFFIFFLFFFISTTVNNIIMTTSITIPTSSIPITLEIQKIPQNSNGGGVRSGHISPLIPKHSWDYPCANKRKVESTVYLNRL